MGGLTTVVALVIAIVARSAYKSYNTPLRTISPYERYFSEDYYQARHLFRESARSAQADLHVIPYPVDGMSDLSIDVAIVRGSPSSLVVHLSGTHGVEGFAGSAIQSAFLSNKTLTQSTASALRPTIAFVHAVNPYGFAKLRRCNEHNVDLNRNHLTPAEFEAVRARDPNHLGYVDLSPVLNPVVADDWSFWTNFALHILRFGYEAGKRTTVAGTYHDPRGLFYGGTELEPSHVLLHDFFSSRFDVDGLKNVVLIDVHTGLGATGEDALDFNRADVGRRIFPDQSVANEGKEAFSGYDGVVGCGVHGYASTWFTKTSPTVLTLQQEFGTIAGLSVLRALRLENALYHHDPTARLGAAAQVRDAFYLHEDPEWKADVVVRGTSALHRIVTYLEAAKPLE
ncbi:hypothetical protein H310_08121 [Aphanomyces invadans]|uniref:DUF2817 domain-containing protein n=1 Tax=Aphanomyces invadans TaxID=157072 RepID=A0A024TZL7_9STRA|nr:hypothetical protein H310_08121 [Aphanomyces invadans]ETV99428.1 hypothetical protein H310_08121 [Aphanomyces invadans]RHY27542.1 hypothetical protein DYB32_006708 [Aphanomyces invadans]|eukprot:XP_008871984.1 hypothetical protein H310_08121 [Aphanomyces invadans]